MIYFFYYFMYHLLEELVNNYLCNRCRRVDFGKTFEVFLTL